MGQGALVLYARTPVEGAVKTRMLPWLTPAEAKHLHIAMLLDSLDLFRTAASAAGAISYLSFSEDQPLEETQGGEEIGRAASGLARLPQTGGDLGSRLLATFRELSDRGHQPIVVIGADSPTLPPPFVEEAFEALRRDVDVVLGPAEDGGYVLIGANRPIPVMFDGIPWGTAEVLRATLEGLKPSGARVRLLPPWHDVDAPADLERLSAESGAPRTLDFVRELRSRGRLPIRS